MFMLFVEDLCFGIVLMNFVDLEDRGRLEVKVNHLISLEVKCRLIKELDVDVGKRLANMKYM